MRLHVSRVVATSGLQQVSWLVFETGNVGKPLAVLTDFEMDLLVAEVQQQQAGARREARREAREK